MVNSCKVRSCVLQNYRISFSNKSDLFWTTTLFFHWSVGQKLELSRTLGVTRLIIIDVMNLATLQYWCVILSKEL
jgi:hypothetical protein